MLNRILNFSINNKLIVILFTLTIAAFGLFAVFQIPVGAVPDITNNQVQVITTSGNLSTQEIEQFITAPVEMEMANLPGVQEIRSVSKFGLSVVTVVFHDNLGTYLPRQLIAEKIKSASANIPEGFGSPEMGPITTGLGEIYQYTLEVQPGFEERYSAMDLRTIQDWVVKRRLSGINGVVEINSWGGYLKQYEVAVNPTLLKAAGLTLMDVFNALETNNSTSGGAYIEKTNQSYFIRGDGMVKSISDIENIVIANNGITPVLVKNVASVSFGHANRYGAITANGKGETVLGQIMMLKDANSKKVINEVKQRVAEIQKNLPDGVVINPVIERSELISKTSFTVAENLILGAIIVMLTVVLLLGNLRSALVIASVIPLALFFTISMMYIFGIDANLMSLGALDFGIIIDGAVIIVEYIALKMGVQNGKLTGQPVAEQQSVLDRVAFEGASKMMKSAIFGQVIILVVFIPIFSLRGVEGKMFHPMALAFSFAIVGAMILGLTWVPVASSLFLRPEKERKRSVSDRIMGLAYGSYLPVIKWSSQHKKLVLGAALLSLLGTGWIFSRMGGEFVPTLDEGDFVIQPVLKTGTSLSKTVELTTRMENILIEKFDEVDQIVSRIGAAEVPTDPMSMEEIDMIIKLKPRKTWVNARSKEELAEKFKEALSVIPGIEYEFTQPIEMRFNELITGVRSDIAIKVFGDDLDYINQKAIEIKNLVQAVEGAGDIILEKTAGLPQIKVEYQRDKIAFYGLNIKELNNYLSAAFGGQTTGSVFEGEKRFDLVVRLPQKSRTDIGDIRQLYVPLPNGNQLPLNELARIEYSEGPAKISREDTHRRVVVSVNVRNRDLKSVVEDIQRIIEQNVTLKPGNYISYGGQFENLQNASRRLMLAVPVALLLIFIFLHFAFKSFRDAALIFSVIPLATVGGVVLLWIRGMPFSVSAGVGFIALFGIAVLNGIVLIEHLKELHDNGITDMRDLIIKGASDRLRPVMLTAGAAAMGFLPMAISTGAGAEVQRPLATVVIGGLVTSTLLTMVALPLLYELFYNVKGVRFFPFRFIRSKTMVMILLLLLPAAFLAGQTKPETKNLEKLLALALENNLEIKAFELKTEESRTLQSTAYALDKTIITYGSDQNNIAENGHPLKVWGVEQGFSFPTVYGAEAKAKRVEVSLAESMLSIKQQQISKQVSLIYYQIQNLQNKQQLYQRMDSLYQRLAAGAKTQQQLGAISRIDLLSLQVQRQKIDMELKTIDNTLEKNYQELSTIINYREAFVIPTQAEMVSMEVADPASNASLRWLQLHNELADAQVKVEQNKLFPDLSVNYFIGTNRYQDAQYYHGFEVGLALPLFAGGQRARIKSSKLALEAQKQLTNYESTLLENRFSEYQKEQIRHKALIDNYQNTGNVLHQELLRSAQRGYQTGEIDLYRFIQIYEQAVQIQFDYFDSVLNFNNASLELIYLTI